jgi:hypothetical protein
MFKNQIISLYPKSIQEKLYSALNSNIPVMATHNRRGIPGDSFINETNGNYIEIVINPNKKQLEYTDFTILSITEATAELMPLEELKEYFQIMEKDNFLEAVKSILYKIKYQYTEEDIYNYLKGSEKE